MTVCDTWEQGQFSFNADSGDGELSAAVRAKLPKCKSTKTYPLAACEWNLQTILSNLKLLKMIPPEAPLPKATLDIPKQSVQVLSGLNQGTCNQPFKVCKQISGSANITLTLGADPVASLTSATANTGILNQVLPAENATVPASQKVGFVWSAIPNATIYQLEITDQAGNAILTALLQQPATNYRAPSWFHEKAAGALLQWRVIALDQSAIIGRLPVADSTA